MIGHHAGMNPQRLTLGELMKAELGTHAAHQTIKPLRHHSTQPAHPCMPCHGRYHSQDCDPRMQARTLSASQWRPTPPPHTEQLGLAGVKNRSVIIKLFPACYAGMDSQLLTVEELVAAEPALNPER